MPPKYSTLNYQIILLKIFKYYIKWSPTLLLKSYIPLPHIPPYLRGLNPVPYIMHCFYQLTTLNTLRLTLTTVHPYNSNNRPLYIILLTLFINYYNYKGKDIVAPQFV